MTALQDFLAQKRERGPNLAPLIYSTGPFDYSERDKSPLPGAKVPFRTKIYPSVIRGVWIFLAQGPPSNTSGREVVYNHYFQRFTAGERSGRAVAGEISELDARSDENALDGDRIEAEASVLSIRTAFLLGSNARVKLHQWFALPTVD